jgi:hypothetical protein
MDGQLVGGIDTFSGLVVDQCGQKRQQGRSHQPGRLSLNRPLDCLGQVIPVEELFADQLTGHVSAAQRSAMPAQQVRSGSSLGGGEEGADVEL